jgi:hypothetical protein
LSAAVSLLAASGANRFGVKKSFVFLDDTTCGDCDGEEDDDKRERLFSVTSDNFIFHNLNWGYGWLRNIADLLLSEIQKSLRDTATVTLPNSYVIVWWFNENYLFSCL